MSRNFLDLVTLWVINVFKDLDGLHLADLSFSVNELISLHGGKFLSSHEDMAMANGR